MKLLVPGVIALGITVAVVGAVVITSAPKSKLTSADDTRDFPPPVVQVSSKPIQVTTIPTVLKSDDESKPQRRSYRKRRRSSSSSSSSSYRRSTQKKSEELPPAVRYDPPSGLGRGRDNDIEDILVPVEDVDRRTKKRG